MIKGDFISTKQGANTFVLEKEFCIKKPKNATLCITALGLYRAEVNGERVGDAFMTPGFTSYNKMLQAQSYDVSDLLKEGDNKIALTVNGGWYCTGLMGPGYRYKFGEKPSVLCELVCDGQSAVSTDTSWSASESYIRFSGIYDGETQDYISPLKKFTPCVVSYDKSKIVGQISEPVKNIESVSVKALLKESDDGCLYDFGQNLTGVVQIVTPADFSGTITVRFAEILVNGKLYTDNLRGAKSTDTYTLSGAKTLCSEFTFHGFRYVEIKGAKLPPQNLTAIVRHTDMKRTGRITTDNARFQRLMDNVVWGQRDNYLDIPTDCPQRDERLGWTGDANAFCTTAAYNYDVRKFFKKWLADVRNDQREDAEYLSLFPPLCPITKRRLSGATAL